VKRVALFKKRFFAVSPVNSGGEKALVVLLEMISRKHAATLRSMLFPLAVSAVMLLLVSHRLIADGDPLWAVATGRWIMAHHAVPRVDPFSWTALGKPWVAHEWGYDTVLYLLTSRLGYCGPVLLTWVGLAGFYTFVWFLCRREEKRLLTTVTAFLGVVLLSRMGVVARPQVFSYFFFALFFYLLTWRRDWRWILPALTVVWANMHASVVLGVTMTVGEALMLYLFERDRSLLPVAGAGFLASLVNPNGLGLWHYALWLSTNPWNRRIAEWKPPDFSAPGDLYPYVAVFLMLGLVLYFHETRPATASDRRRLAILALYLCALSYQAVTQVRYFPYLLVPWVVAVLRLMPGRTAATGEEGGAPTAAGAGYRLLGAGRRGGVWPVAGVAVFLVSGVFGYGAGVLPRADLAANLQAAVAPAAAVSYIQTHGLTSHLFNNYVWGGYLIYEGLPVFVDGRDDLYLASTNVFQDYLETTGLTKDPDAVLARYGVDTVLMPQDAPLTRYLEAEPRKWETVYNDKTAAVLRRVTARGGVIDSKAPAP